MRNNNTYKKYNLKKKEIRKNKILNTWLKIKPKCNQCNNDIDFEKYYSNNNRKSLNLYCNANCQKKYYYRTNLKRKLMHTLRCRLKIFVKQRNYKKNASITLMLGCSPSELRTYIENQFIKGMSWDNWALKGWHIDHIKPLASARTEEELLKLCHYTNLQPLWAYDNLSKGTKF